MNKENLNDSDTPKLEYQNCKKIGKISRSVADEENLSNSILELKLLSCLDWSLY